MQKTSTHGFTQLWMFSEPIVQYIALIFVSEPYM